MLPIMQGNLVFATDFVVDLITFTHSSRWIISQPRVESSLGNSRGV